MTARGASSSEPDAIDRGVPSRAASAAIRPSSLQNSASARRRLAARGGRSGEWLRADPRATRASRPRCARVSHMKPSTPLGCQERSPRSRSERHVIPPRSPASSSPMPPMQQIWRDPEAFPDGRSVPSGCLLVFSTGVKPVCSDSKKLAHPGEGASWPCRLGVMKGSASGHPLASASPPPSRATFRRDGVAASGTLPWAAMPSMSFPVPKLRSWRNARSRCSRRGPSFFGRTVGGLSSCTARSAVLPAGAGLAVCLRAGERAGPKACCWHSMDGRPTLAATRCQNCGALGRISWSAPFSLRVSSWVHHSPVALRRRFCAARSVPAVLLQEADAGALWSASGSRDDGTIAVQGSSAAVCREAGRPPWEYRTRGIQCRVGKPRLKRCRRSGGISSLAARRRDRGPDSWTTIRDRVTSVVGVIACTISEERHSMPSGPSLSVRTPLTRGTLRPLRC
mmetsp:Transcript_18344/g.57713  ORF Transcript_18344/g.57713 Transcript_18344/m.57713 type:complete len:453 (+) Transcript_18344:126-1484(+)